MEFLYQRFAQCKSANIENNTKIAKVRQLLQPSPCSPHPTIIPYLFPYLAKRAQINALKFHYNGIEDGHTLSDICSNKTSDKQGKRRLKVGSPIVCGNPNTEQDIGPKIVPCALETVFSKAQRKDWSDAQFDFLFSVPSHHTLSDWFSSTSTYLLPSPCLV